MFTKQIALAALLALLVFVTPASVLADCPGDMNSDNFLDFVDVEAFLGCMLGPGVPLDPGCEPGDIDLDADADMADFAAVQVAFGTSCDPQEVVLRDSIGTDNTTTNDNFPFATYKISDSAHVIIPAVVTAPSNLSLGTLRLVVAQMTTPLVWENFDYYVRVWSDLPTAISQPLSGNIANVFFAAPSFGPDIFGVTGNFGSLGITATYEIQFDLSSAGIVLNAGETRAIGISITTDGCDGGFGQSGCLGIMETTEVGDSDTQISPILSGGWRYVTSSSFSRHDGRVAWDIRGMAR